MKKFTICLLTLSILICTYPMRICANTQFSVNVGFDYPEEGGSFIKIEGVTPAQYVQGITAVVYDPGFNEDWGLSDILNEEGNLPEDIAAAAPLTNVSDILRVANTTSGKNGSFEMRISLEKIANGQYMIVSIGGGGREKQNASTILYYEQPEYLQNATLPAFEKADKTNLGELLADKEFLLGINLRDYYGADGSYKDDIISLFTSVRNEDFAVDISTDKKFNSFDDVIKVLDYSKALLPVADGCSETEFKTFIEYHGSLVGYDFSNTNDDYQLVKNTYATLTASILSLEGNNPKSMSAINKAITQAVGIATINSKDSDTIGSYIDKYGAILGVNPTDYATYCDLYTAYEVNKAFVAKGFTLPSQFSAALTARIETLREGQDNGHSGGGYSPGGVTGGNAGKSYFDSGFGNLPTVTTTVNISFNDVSDEHWANEAILSLAEKDVLDGFEDGSFKPDDMITREQFVKVIVTAFNLYYDNGISNFNDVPKERWSYKYILIAASGGIVNGTSEGTFAPEAAVSRQDAAVMLARLCKKKGIALDGQVTSVDSNEISDYAKESVAKLKAAKIISGFEDGSFRPMEILTRAQAAKLVYGMLNG